MQRGKSYGKYKRLSNKANSMFSGFQKNTIYAPGATKEVNKTFRKNLSRNASSSRTNITECNKSIEKSENDYSFEEKACDRLVKYMEDLQQLRENSRELLSRPIYDSVLLRRYKKINKQERKIKQGKLNTRALQALNHFSSIKERTNTSPKPNRHPPNTALPKMKAMPYPSRSRVYRRLLIQSSTKYSKLRPRQPTPPPEPPKHTKSPYASNFKRLGPSGDHYPLMRVPKHTVLQQTVGWYIGLSI